MLSSIQYILISLFISKNDGSSNDFENSEIGYLLNLVVHFISIP